MFHGHMVAQVIFCYAIPSGAAVLLSCGRILLIFEPTCMSSNQVKGRL